MTFNDFDIKMGDYTRYKLAGAIYDVLTERAKALEEVKFYAMMDRVNDATIKAGYGYYEFLPKGSIKWKDMHIRHRKMNILVYVKEVSEGEYQIVVSEGKNCRVNNLTLRKCHDREEASDFVDMYKKLYDTEDIDYRVDLYDDKPFDLQELHEIIVKAIG